MVESPLVKIKLLGGIPPLKAHEGDAGWDLYYNYEPEILWPRQKIKVPLGFAIELPYGWVALIQGKSGLADTYKLTTIGNVIDSTYRGECHAILLNLGVAGLPLKRGMKIAQMLILPCYCGIDYQLVNELSPTDRGSGGFGSTGG